MKTAAELRDEVAYAVAEAVDEHSCHCEECELAYADKIALIGYRKALAGAKALQDIGFHGPIGFVRVDKIDALDAVAAEIAGAK